MSVNIYDSTTQTLTRVDKDANFTGATSSAAGTSGSVPAPAAGDQGKFLKGDGSWDTPTDTKYDGSTLKTKVAQSGSAQSSVASSIAANTSLDSAVGTLLNNDATLNTALTNQVLHFDIGLTAATNSYIVNVSGGSYANITADHYVVECVFDKPNAITTDVTWTTGNGTLTLVGTCTDAASNSAHITLAKKGN